AGLGRDQPVGPRALQGHGDRLDAGLVALLVVVDRHLEPAPLGPALQHPPEHLGPVLGLGPPGAGMDGDDRVPVVELPAQQGEHLEVVGGRGQGGQPLAELAGHRVVVLLEGELVQRLEVLELALEPGHRLEVALDGGQPAHHPAGPLRVVPQVGRGRLLAQGGQLPFLARQVKGTPWRRRAACAAPPAPVRDRWAWVSGLLCASARGRGPDHPTDRRRGPGSGGNPGGPRGVPFQIHSRPQRGPMSMQRPPWLVVVLLVVALISTAGWAITAPRSAPEGQASAAGGATPAPRAAPEGQASAAGGVTQANAHAGHVPAHSHGGTAQYTPPIAPRDGVVVMSVPPLPKTAVNFIWKPEHLVVAAGQKVTLKVANADYMQHNFTFRAAKVARNLPVDATTTTIQLTAPAKPG